MKTEEVSFLPRRMFVVHRLSDGSPLFLRVDAINAVIPYQPLPGELIRGTETLLYHQNLQHPISVAEHHDAVLKAMAHAENHYVIHQRKELP